MKEKTIQNIGSDYDIDPAFYPFGNSLLEVLCATAELSMSVSKNDEKPAKKKE